MLWEQQTLTNVDVKSKKPNKKNPKPRKTPKPMLQSSTSSVREKKIEFELPEGHKIDFYLNSQLNCS